MPVDHSKAAQELRGAAQEPRGAAQERAIRDPNEGVVEAVAAGEGVGVVSSWVLERPAHDVRAVRLDGDPVARPQYLVLRRGDPLGPGLVHDRTRAGT